MEKDKLTAIVVDDEQEAVDYLCDLLGDYNEIQLLDCFTDSQKAIIEINNLMPDILFLDVQMPVKTGFDVVKSIRNNEYEPHIIFTTGFEKYAIRAIKYAAFDYLLKPINAYELENALQKIITFPKKRCCFLFVVFKCIIISIPKMKLFIPLFK